MESGSAVITPHLLEKLRASSGRNCKSRFLSQLFGFLESGQHNDIVSWSDDGTKFVVKNSSLFADIVLPILYSHSNFPSFTRQLYMYYFKKSRDSGYRFCYANPNFIRNRRDLLENINRRKVRQNSELEILSGLQPQLEDLERENDDLKRRHKQLKFDLEVTQGIIAKLNFEKEMLSEEVNRRQNNGFYDEMTNQKQQPQQQHQQQHQHQQQSQWNFSIPDDIFNASQGQNMCESYYY